MRAESVYASRAEALLFDICNLGHIKAYFHWELEYASR